MRNTFNRKFKVKVGMDVFMSPNQTLLDVIHRLESELENHLEEGESLNRRPVVEFLRDHVPSWDEGIDLMTLGMDSLDLVQMRNTFNRKFKVKVGMDVFRSPNQT